MRDVPALDRIVFFGTPEFAVPALDALVAAGRTPILVVTQPARPAGRRRRLTQPPVAERARKLGIEVAQPERVRDEEFLERLAGLAPDLAVVVAFGQIFPARLLELPRLGCLNVHASLLPRWRGASPIAAAIAAGDDETGVAVQRMELGLDTGPVFASRATPIDPEETTGGLSARLAAIGAELLVEVVAALESGEAESQAQDSSLATWAPKVSGVRELDLAAPADEIAAQVRAYGEEPGTVIAIAGERIKIAAATSRRASDAARGAPPGTVLAIGTDELTVQSGEGVLDIRRAQRPGGRPISGRDLANGLRVRPGDRLP